MINKYPCYITCLQCYRTKELSAPTEPVACEECGILKEDYIHRNLEYTHYPLNMWTVYDHPKDFPDFFVCRQFVISDGTPIASDNFGVSREVDTLRWYLEALGCTRIATTDPDPNILETWM